VNRALIRRWINEYLDGEIGLADKAELERIMAGDPQVRNEYLALRRVGLLLGGMPEVEVHPTRFRRRVLDALDARERLYFTPQRAFATAMLVALLVVGLTFGMLLYQQKMLPDRLVLTGTPADEISAASAARYDLQLQVRTTPEAFFSRLALECQLGLSDPALLAPFVTQSHTYEGASCTRGHGLEQMQFPAALPSAMAVNLTPQQALQLQSIAEELAGRECALNAQGRDGSQLPLQDFLQLNPAGSAVKLYISFN
jgi:hypothetical protein